MMDRGEFVHTKKTNKAPEINASLPMSTTNPSTRSERLGDPYVDPSNERFDEKVVQSLPSTLPRTVKRSSSLPGMPQNTMKFEQISQADAPETRLIIELSQCYKTGNDSMKPLPSLSSLSTSAFHRDLITSSTDDFRDNFVCSEAPTNSLFSCRYFR
ncbi:hypothetical protein DPMN_116767 [Dreissena polymorpha]|uniref:Uncharacterized protein n=1 Tax=Dreissena polymorpha TaxID=45954 RepID=A0A9D4QV19_DREPO|nr:hypothetical protein DPMN_116767 [Dreissena polymorpha]